MASSELTFEQIYLYFKENGGVVKNRDAVSAFKRYLTDSRSKEDARNKFRTYINTLAHTKKGENDEKYLVLKTKYLNSLEAGPPSPSPSMSSLNQYDPRNSIGIPLSPSDFSPMRGSTRQPPPYRPPPPVVASPSLSMDNVSISSFSLDGTPLAPPRRRSADKFNMERTKSMEEKVDPNRSTDEMRTPRKNSAGVLEERDPNVDDKPSMSVKEKTQRFNRLASYEDEHSPKPAKTPEKKGKGADQDDGASIPMVDNKKCVEWYVTASKGEYQDLIKLAIAEPRLAKKKVSFQIL
ncbi:unnamed protein product [Brassicogethes aeneus]|uniref:SOWAHA-C winged helix-turn-helix domain-containing protein n=1 Tax=Brassicogethes aeneus TaxID=1431903 RepID=A0A9P0APT9_BRAAE|nr:unnamed protein product [Brassicogethes aeneus]